MNKEEVLQNFGLTESEVKAYLALLRTGELSANELSKVTNSNRTFTYDRLNKLLKSGLVSYSVKDNKKYFKAVDPNQLLSIIKEREEQIKEILPDLEKLQKPVRGEPNVQIFTSEKGIRTALNLILKERKKVYIHGSVSDFKSNMGTFYEIWNKRRVREGIHFRILSNEEINLEMAETDMLPDYEKSSSTTFTFGDKTISVLWSDVPIAIYIESEEIAKDNISLFNNIWDREVKIYSGLDGLVKAFFELIAKKNSTYMGFGYSWALSQIYGVKLSDEEWHPLRLKKNIIGKLISYDDPKSVEYFRERKNKWKDFHVKFLDEDTCGPACVTFSEHMIATFIYTEKNLKVVVSKNKETIAAYKKYFERLWKKAKP